MQLQLNYLQILQLYVLLNFLLSIHIIIYIILFERVIIVLKISISNLQPGMIIAKNIYDADANLLLSKDIVLTANYINRLKVIGLSSVYILTEKKHNNIIYQEDIIREEIRLKAIKSIGKTFQKCLSTKKLDVEEINDVTNTIIDEIMQSKTRMIQLSDIIAFDEYTFGHSVNVCAISTMIGILCQYSPKRLHELALGAILHDIGKILIPIEILNKKEKLTDSEMSLMRKHSELGFELLRKTSHLSVVPMHIAFQHHENFNGSGYPRGLSESRIHHYARIVTIADVYDAITTDRPYQKARTPYQAYEIMLSEASVKYDISILEKFFDNLVIFNVGSLILLSNGFYAMVTDLSSGLPFYPVIKIIAKPNRDILTEDIYIDLKEYHSIKIIRSLSEAESIELLSELDISQIELST